MLPAVPAHAPRRRALLPSPGTGKSSLVCAICIGLGGSTKVRSSPLCCGPRKDAWCMAAGVAAGSSALQQARGTRAAAGAAELTPTPPLPLLRPTSSCWAAPTT